MASTRHGKLLDAADAAGYQALITIDKGIAHQQDMAKRKVAVILLDTLDTRISVLDRLAPDVAITLANLEPGKLYVLKLRESE